MGSEWDKSQARAARIRARAEMELAREDIRAAVQKEKERILAERSMSPLKRFTLRFFPTTAYKRK